MDLLIVEEYAVYLNRLLYYFTTALGVVEKTILGLPLRFTYSSIAKDSVL